MPTVSFAGFDEEEGWAFSNSAIFLSCCTVEIVAVEIFGLEKVSDDEEFCSLDVVRAADGALLRGDEWRGIPCARGTKPMK